VHTDGPGATGAGHGADSPASSTDGEHERGHLQTPSMAWRSFLLRVNGEGRGKGKLAAVTCMGGRGAEGRRGVERERPSAMAVRLPGGGAVVTREGEERRGVGVGPTDRERGRVGK
jgi:hypothetical protein